jgi:hypothetical protein
MASSKKKTKKKYRNTFEESIAKSLKGLDFEYEETKIPYTLLKEYVVDFHVKDLGFIIEAKGRLKDKDKQLLLALKEQYPSLDVRIVFQTDNFLGKRSDTLLKKMEAAKKKKGKALSKSEKEELYKGRMKYSDWAVKHGFKYAIGKVPKEWLRK